MASHTHAFEDAAGRVAGADGAACAVAVRLAVRFRAAGKVVALHDAGESAPFARACDIDPVAWFEDLDANALSDCVLRGLVDLKLAQVAQVALLLEMAAHGLVAAFGCAEAELYGIVAVAIGSLDLRDQAGPGFDHRRAAHAALWVEHLDHAKLSAENAIDHSFTSMSTPAGSCSRISVSTVREDGFSISMMRLCVRISNCSRESLSMNGERITVNFLICVGRGIGPATTAPVRSAASTICSADWSRMRWSYALSRIRSFCCGMSYTFAAVTRPTVTFSVTSFGTWA